MEQPTSRGDSAGLVKAVHGVRYQVKDVARAVAFYTGRLGFTLKHQQLPAFANVSLGETAARNEIAREAKALYRPFRANLEERRLHPGLEPARSLAPSVLRDRAGSAPWAASVAPPLGRSPPIAMACRK